MGLAASRFATLTELCEGAPHRFSNIKLSAIVLSDPTNVEFNRHLSERMDYLNTRTGNSFLFFALIDPPAEWEGAPNPILKDDQLFMSMPSFSPKGDRAALYNFLQQIGYYDAPIPGMLLTSGDLLSKSYIYFPTSIERIEDQLIALGDLCAHHTNPVGLRSAELKHLLDAIAPLWDYNSTTRPIAYILRLVSAYKDVKHESIHNRELANEVIRKSLQVALQNQDMRYVANVLQYLETLYSEDPDDESECQELLQPICIPKHLPIDQETEINWNTYNEFLHLLRKVQSLSQEHQSINLSVVNIPLMIGVEKELNMSIVQYMRSLFGIPMPEYYCRWMERYPVSVNHGNNEYEIKLNERCNANLPGRLKSVSIGDIRGAFIELIPNSFGSDSDMFIDLLYFFSHYRITHSGREYRSDAQQMEELLQCREKFDYEFMRFLPELCDLKMELQTPKTFQKQSDWVE